MFEKIEILIIIYTILFLFYLVILFGAGKRKNISQSKEIKSYLRGVRYLLIMLAVVALILWILV